MGLPYESAGYTRDDATEYCFKKIAVLDESKFTYVARGSGEIGYVYAMKEKENGDYCWYGPQKTLRPNIGMRQLVWGGHMSDWIATSAVQAYCIINDPEGADKLVINKEFATAGFELDDRYDYQDGDGLILTRNSVYAAFKWEKGRDIYKNKRETA